MAATKDTQARIWGVSTVLVVLAVILAFGTLRHTEAVATGFSFPLPVLVLAFVAAEYFVVHVHFRSESGTFSFAEVPLMLGALFVPPLQVWAAMTFGAAAAFVVLRKQTMIKASFNTANLSLQAATALWLYHTLVGAVDPLAPIGWAAAAIAATVSSALNVSALLVVVSIIESRVDLAGIRQSVMMGSATSVTNAALALIAATLIDARPISLLLLTAPVIVLFIAYRTFVSEREHRERIQHMYESASEIQAMRHDSAIPDTLAATSTRLRARRSDLFLLHDEATGQLPTWFSVVEDTRDTSPVSLEALAAIPELAEQCVKPRLLNGDELVMLSELVKSDLESALVGVVKVEGGVYGLLAVSDRLGDVAQFTDGDVALFSTIVYQLTLALENNELGQAISELQRVERELSEQAHHDPLTGLANRNKLASVLGHSTDGSGSVTVLYIDLDDFKLINDGLGHQAGDSVLIETAARLRAAVRESDCVARIGGDEFVVVLDQTSQDLQTAKRLLEVVNQPITLDSHEVQIGASIGLTRSRPGQDPASLLAAADAAMYSAKGTGKGTVVVDKQTTPTQIRTTTHV